MSATLTAVPERSAEVTACTPPLRITRACPTLSGQPYLVPIPPEGETTLLNASGSPLCDMRETVLASLFDAPGAARPRQIVLPDGRRLPIPPLAWHAVNAQDLLDPLTSGLGYRASGRVVRLPAVHVLLNALLVRLEAGTDDIEETLGRIGVAAAKETHRLIQDKGITWSASPAVRGHIARCDDLALDEVGLDPEDMAALQFRDGDSAHGMKYPVSGRGSVRRVVVRALPGLGPAIAFPSGVIKHGFRADVDGDEAVIWKDRQDFREERHHRPDVRRSEHWGGFRSRTSLRTLFPVRPDPIEATIDKREKSTVASATFAIWVSARAAALISGSARRAYGDAYDLGGEILERAFDRRKGTQPIPLDVEAFTDGLYGYGPFPAAMLAANGLDPGFYETLLRVGRGNLLNYTSQTSTIFGSVLVGRSSPARVIELLQAFAMTGLPWDRLMPMIRRDMALSDRCPDGLPTPDPMADLTDPDALTLTDPESALAGESGDTEFEEALADGGLDTDGIGAADRSFDDDPFDWGGGLASLDPGR